MRPRIRALRSALRRHGSCYLSSATRGEGGTDPATDDDARTRFPIPKARRTGRHRAAAGGAGAGGGLRPGEFVPGLRPGPAFQVSPHRGNRRPCPRLEQVTSTTLLMQRIETVPQHLQEGRVDPVMRSPAASRVRTRLAMPARSAPPLRCRLASRPLDPLPGSGTKRWRTESTLRSRAAARAGYPASGTSLRVDDTADQPRRIEFAAEPRPGIALQQLLE